MEVSCQYSKLKRVVYKFSESDVRRALCLEHKIPADGRLEFEVIQDDPLFIRITVHYEEEMKEPPNAPS